VAGSDLDKVWMTPTPGTLAEDLERFPGELSDPYA
jgi:hypothetical protein